MTTTKHVIAFLDEMSSNTTLSAPTQNVVKNAKKRLKSAKTKDLTKTINRIKSDIEYLEADEEVLPTELTELWQVSHMLEEMQNSI